MNMYLSRLPVRSVSYPACQNLSQPCRGTSPPVSPRPGPVRPILRLHLPPAEALCGVRLPDLGAVQDMENDLQLRGSRSRSELEGNTGSNQQSEQGVSCKHVPYPYTADEPVPYQAGSTCKGPSRGTQGIQTPSSQVNTGLGFMIIPTCSILTLTKQKRSLEILQHEPKPWAEGLGQHAPRLVQGVGAGGGYPWRLHQSSLLGASSSSCCLLGMEFFSTAPTVCVSARAMGIRKDVPEKPETQRILTRINPFRAAGLSHETLQILLKLLTVLHRSCWPDKSSSGLHRDFKYQKCHKSYKFNSGFAGLPGKTIRNAHTLNCLSVSHSVLRLSTASYQS